MVTIELNRRIDLLDYLRGFALVGILLVNIVSLLAADTPAAHSIDAFYWRFLYLFVEGRFYTIFTFLFGVGFYIFMTRAQAKQKNGYVLFLRRLLVLLFVGLIHMKFHPGEALTLYAIAGFILLPFYKVDRVVNLLFGFAMLLILSLFAAKIFMILPLMLIGIAAGQYHVFERISHHMKKVAVVTSLLFILCVAGLLYQFHFAPSRLLAQAADGTFKDAQQFFSIGITVGPVVSAFYVGSMILLLQFPVFQTLFTPLKSYGRMAFTNYLFQTAFILLAGKGLNLSHNLTYVQSLYVCIVIYLIQFIFSTIWLHFFHYGPLEWVWRALTYWEIPPLRKSSQR